jgi:5'-3' exoribonuclease 1
MARLSEQLKYFIAKKVSEDSSWASVKVILSGHDVPGEGEHKIMDYIRKTKSSSNYEPNTRHCLYGLDADLIMLGLLSHEPHFALLREEVTFGGRGKKKSASGSNPDSINFFLMHLSLFREYLDLEFSTLKDILPFPYSLESIIDDFILLSFFVGNDFLPHLPGLHINEGALSSFFKIYKACLPLMGGYINNSGYMDLQRVEVLLQNIGEMERESFMMERVDDAFMVGKTGRKPGKGLNKHLKENPQKPHQRKGPGIIFLPFVYLNLLMIS